MSAPIFAYNPITGLLDLTFPGGGGGGGVTSVSGTLNRITVANGTTMATVDISASYVGQTSITTLGTITTGTWAGTAIAPTSGGTGISTYTTGDILFASAANTLSKLPIGTVGQLLTVSGGLPSWQSGSGATITITGNTGGAISSGTFNLLTANTTAVFAGSGSTFTLDFGLSNLLIGTTAPGLTVASHNASLGNTALNAVTSGSGNTAIGTNACDSLDAGSNNVAVGYNALITVTGSNQNTAIGVSSLESLAASTGSNTAVGYAALNTISTGVSNIALGANAGGNLSTSDSSNICVGNSGVSGDNNTMRLGTQGTGTGQISKSKIAGQIQTVSGRIRKTTTVTTTYTTLITDDIIYADSTSAGFTITLIASPDDGQQFVIKDSVGTATANNITVIASSGNIDGASSFVINLNYGSATFVYNSSASRWSVI